MTVPDDPATLSEALMAATEPQAFEALLEHRPLSLWQGLARSSPNLKEDLAHAKAAPVEFLMELAKDESPELRWKVAMRRKLSRTAFELLASDPDPWVRMAIAKNPKVPADLLLVLLNDPDPDVAQGAAWRADRRGGGIQPR